MFLPRDRLELIRNRNVTRGEIHNTDLVKDHIAKFIEYATKLSQPEKDSLIQDVSEMSDAAVKALYARMIADIASAATLMWKARLDQYLKRIPPPQKYATDRGTRTPREFLEDVWGAFMDHNVLYQDTLSDYDDKLIPALYRHWQLHGRAPGDRLPPPRQKRTDAILDSLAVYTPYSIEEIKKAVRAIDRRESRARSR